MLVCQSIMLQMTRETIRLGRIRRFLHTGFICAIFLGWQCLTRWLILILLMQVNCDCDLTV